MTALKTVTMAAALIAGATSMAMAQSGSNNGMPPSSYKGPGSMPMYSSSQVGNTGANAAATGGSGTHASSLKTGSAASTQKVIGNQNGYRLSANANNGMPPSSYKGPGSMPMYSSNTAVNAAASGGGGTHATSLRTGSAASTQKVIGNRNGYRRLYASRSSSESHRLRY
jgi:hypothetical protein